MKTYSNISFPSKVRFRKKVHSQTSDHVWFFLNLFSKRPREKKEKEKKGKKEKNSSFLLNSSIPKAKRYVMLFNL